MGTSPAKEIESALIREQLERILASPLFKASKRNPSLLRYVVERTIEDKTESLKERTLGVEVFGREPDYDTGADHIVRSTAGEVRKRLAQYYQEPGRETELRIELPAGSYVPQFHAPHASQGQAAPEAKAPRWTRQAVALIAVGGMAFIAGVLFSRPSPFPDPRLAHFWGAVAARSGAPVLLCVGEEVLPAATSSPAPGLGDLRSMTHQTINIEDAVALSRFSAVLAGMGAETRILTQSATTLDDLRQGPAVLIGAFNNDWTTRLMEDLRFRFDRLEARSGSISDRQNPSQAPWSPKLSDPKGNVTTGFVVTRDYAIVARWQSPRTGRMTVAAAGITGYGTTAAAEFLTNPVYLKKLEAQAPGGWAKMGIEVVLSTEVVKGIASAPAIVAAHFW